jgi:hypothetical protein
MENRIHGSPVGGQFIKKAILTIIELKYSRRGKTMKINKLCPFSLIAFLVALIVCNPNAYADPSKSGTATVSVANTIHSAAQVVSLSEEFDSVMAEYDSEYLKEKKEELLNRAQNILNKLIEQANNVESEISILSKKKLDKIYSQKLERVLSNVLRMREAAEKKMQTADQAG